MRYVTCKASIKKYSWWNNQYRLRKIESASKDAIWLPNSQTITYVSNVFITEETAFLWTCYTMLEMRVQFASCFCESATRAQLCCQRPCPAPAIQKQIKARFGPHLTRKYTQKTHKLTTQVQQKRGQYALKNNPS